MAFPKRRVYQGPSQPTKTILKPNQVLHNVHFQQVGWSLLRNLTSFEWEPLLIVPSGVLGTVRDCIFEMKGDKQ